MSEEDESVSRPPSSKKRKSFGRMTDVGKKLRLSSHETGEDCHCKKLKCFQNVTPAIRQVIVSDFNQIKTYDEQSVYLCGLITCKQVARHRPRKSEDEADLHSYSYTYKVRAIKDNDLFEIPICYKAFLSVHGITAKRVQTLQEGLKSTGKAPTDNRGKHENRPNKIPSEVTDSIVEHIKSFKTRSSHYSLAKSKKLYLPEELNVKKCIICTRQSLQNIKYLTRNTERYLSPNLTYPSGTLDAIPAAFVMRQQFKLIQLKINLKKVIQNWKYTSS